MEKLNVLYLTDNNYATYAGVSITSLFINNQDIEEITVYIIDDNIAAENKEKIEKTAKEYGRQIVFLDLTAGIRILQEMNIPKYRNSYTTYLKLFTFNLLPDDVERIFFIDSDTIIVGSLKEMISIDMSGNMIGAVRDGITHPYKLALGYAYNDSWFNMGVMLVDVFKWKRENAQEKIIEQLKKRRGYIAVDQDLLNITQHGNIMTLHPKYNATPHHYVFKEKAFRRAFRQGGFYEDLATMEEAQKDARIRHFERFMGESAWHKDTIHPYAYLFDSYLEKSLWKGYQKKKVMLSGALKIENTLYKLLPKGLFIYIYATGFKWFLLRLNKKLLKDENLNNIE